MGFWWARISVFAGDGLAVEADVLTAGEGEDDQGSGEGEEPETAGRDGRGGAAAQTPERNRVLERRTRFLRAAFAGEGLGHGVGQVIAAEAFAEDFAIGIDQEGGGNAANAIFGGELVLPAFAVIELRPGDAVFLEVGRRPCLCLRRG